LQIKLYRILQVLPLMLTHNGSTANNETVYVRAPITSAVPEPSTYALMLSGLRFSWFYGSTS